MVQSQECVFIKGVMEGKSNGLLAKLTFGVHARYKHCLDYLLSSQISENLSSSCHSLIKTKQTFYHALSYYYQALICRESEKFGEAISLLNVILSNLVETDTNVIHTIDDFKSKCQVLLKECEKENDFIFHQPTVCVSSLAPIGIIDLSQFLPFNDAISLVNLSTISSTLFQNIFPLPSVGYLSQYTEEKAKIIRYETMKVDTADEEICLIKSKLSQFTSFEETMKSLSSNLKEKIKQMLMFEDILLKRMDHIQILESKLGNISKTMEADFGQTRSSNCTEDCDKLQDKFHDVTVQLHSRAARFRKMNLEYEHNIKRPLIQLKLVDDHIPSPDPKDELFDFSIHTKQLLANLEEISAARNELLSSLKIVSESEDICQKFIGCKDADILIDQELRKFDALCNNIEENIKEQAVIKEQLVEWENKTRNSIEAKLKTTGLRDIEEQVREFVQVSDELGSAIS
jgi:hypothetical protein